MATHSSREGKSPPSPPLKKTTGGGSASVFNLVAAQTAHVRAAHPFNVMFYSTTVRACSSVRDCELKTAHCSTEMPPLVEKYGENGPTISELAIN